MFWTKHYQSPSCWNGGWWAKPVFSLTTHGLCFSRALYDGVKNDECGFFSFSIVVPVLVTSLSNIHSPKTQIQLKLCPSQMLLHPAPIIQEMFFFFVQYCYEQGNLDFSAEDWRCFTEITALSYGPTQGTEFKENHEVGSLEMCVYFVTRGHAAALDHYCSQCHVMPRLQQL